MSKPRIVPTDKATAILKAFREVPHNASRAARLAHCDARTARKAWERGLPSCPDPQFHRPFKDIVRDEQEEARAQLEKQKEEIERLRAEAEAKRQQDTHEAALEDVAKQRAQEELLIRNARTATIVLLNNVTNIAAGATALGGKVRQALEARAKDEEALSMVEAGKLVTLIQRLGTTLRQCNDAGQKAMEMSRLLVGEPTSIVGVQHLENISMDEARQRVEAAQRAMEYLDKSGVGIVDGSPASMDPKFN